MTLLQSDDSALILRCLLRELQDPTTEAGEVEQLGRLVTHFGTTSGLAEMLDEEEAAVVEKLLADVLFGDVNIPLSTNTELVMARTLRKIRRTHV